MRAVVAGVGAVGARVARQLLAIRGLERLSVFDIDPARAAAAVESLGPSAQVIDWPPAPDDADVIVVATPGDHSAMAEQALRVGAHVVSVAGGLTATRSLLALDAEACERQRVVAIGCAMSPGLSCLLALHAAAEFEQVDEIHVASLGVGGPGCARDQRAALGRSGVDWDGGAWVPRRGGRWLCWFPDPIGARDSYRAALGAPLLLAPGFPGVQRVTARVAATRRKRLSARLPAFGSRQPEGEIGAVRVEVRGRREGAQDVRVLGVLDRPAVAAAAVAAVAASLVVDGRARRHGAAGLAGLIEDPLPVLHELAARGVRAAVFEGSGARMD